MLKSLQGNFLFSIRFSHKKSYFLSSCRMDLTQLRSLLHIESGQDFTISFSRQDGTVYFTIVKPKESDEFDGVPRSKAAGPAFPEGFIWAKEQRQHEYRFEPRKSSSPSRNREILRVSRIEVRPAAIGVALTSSALDSCSPSSNLKAPSNRRPWSANSFDIDLRKVAPTGNGRKIITASAETVKYTASSLKDEKATFNEGLLEASRNVPSSIVTTTQVRGWKRVLICHTTRAQDASKSLAKSASGHSPVSQRQQMQPENEVSRSFMATNGWKRRSKAAEQLRSKIMQDKYELQSALATSNLRIGPPFHRHLDHEKYRYSDTGQDTAVPGVTPRRRQIEVPPLPNHFSGRCSFYDHSKARVKQALEGRPPRIGL